MGKMRGTKEQLRGEVEVEQATQETIAQAHRMLNKSITKAELVRALGKLRKKKTPGGDLIPNEVYTALEGGNVGKMASALERCRQENKFPEGWKTTELRWLYKKGDPLQISNYRPIALAEVLYKVFTRIMTSQLEEGVEGCYLLEDEQQGF
jgi:hypothetical protein